MTCYKTEGNVTYDANTKVITITQAGATDFDVKIEGAGRSSARIVIQSGAKGQITLNNVDILPASGPALLIESGCEVTLIIGEMNNHLTSGDDSSAGLQVNPGATLTIKALSPDAKLTAEGKLYGAGIGGGQGNGGSNITIESGTIEAEGSWGAGIGGGQRGNGGGQRGNGSNIKITGGTVTAESEYGAGIGGGDGGDGYDIEISGGTVTATAHRKPTTAPASAAAEEGATAPTSQSPAAP